MTTNLIPLPSVRGLAHETPWAGINDGIVIGKDILELLSTSMYVDPMSIYREYVQNAADSIDEARAVGILGNQAAGSVGIEIDSAKRSIRIRDSGTGVPATAFVQRLVAFGASVKRGRSARGFRGVGRLAGLGYCQELLFRSRAQGDCGVSELLWDCRKLRSLLRVADSHHHLRDVVVQTVSTRSVETGKAPAHFFEVELRGVVRHRNDQLLDPHAIRNYLAQCAPVPFSSELSYGEEISNALKPYVMLGELRIEVSGVDGPICRPHRNTFPVGMGNSDSFRSMEPVTIPALDGGIAAVGWVLHHGYVGALAPSIGIKGLRVRCGNIQVGDDRLFEDLFLEPRFNSWTVGEVHIVDPRILPNGRRDHFEQNAHYQNLLTHLTPLARDLSRRCRSSSIKRNRSREFERLLSLAGENVAIIAQRAVGKNKRNCVVREVLGAIAELENMAASGLVEAASVDPIREIAKLKRHLAKAADLDASAGPLSSLASHQRRTYEEVFSLIYECSPNRAAAKVLVERILARIR
jgi:molecular chaperone HtpG